MTEASPVRDSAGDAPTETVTRPSAVVEPAPPLLGHSAPSAQSAEPAHIGQSVGSAQPLGSAQPVASVQPEVTFVPMAVTIGDGFKFGCGFFLALVVAALVGFVLLAALFVLTGLFGLNLPLGR